MRRTIEIGNESEAKFLARLLATGVTVLIPFGSGCRYDMAVDTDSGIKKVQVKTARINKDGSCLEFNTCSNNKGSRRRSYHNDADFIGAYCPDLDKCYMVPVSLTGSSMMKLRLKPTKNGQARRIHEAIKYEL